MAMKRSHIAAIAVLGTAFAAGSIYIGARNVNSKVYNQLTSSCWRLEREKSSFTKYCFNENGKIDGVYFDSGHGADLEIDWRLNSKTSLTIGNEICNFKIQSTVLLIANCEYQGPWHAVAPLKL